MNPQIKKFLEDYPHITLLGLGWAIYWRFVVIVFAVCMGFGIIGALFSI